MKFLDTVQKLANEGKLPKKITDILQKFYYSYAEAIKKNDDDISAYEPLLQQFLDLFIEELQAPYTFDPYHESIRTPIDYYQLGLDFIRPIVKLDFSQVLGLENVDDIAMQISQGDNVILFANHQTEPDPQAISLLLEKTHPKLAEDMIFVAGQRVITDPLAVPFSKGRNLLCIYSKNYIEHPPDKKQEKLAHNQSTMKRMRELLSEGSKCIYVAPSGGRDRPDASDRIRVKPFDPQSIEMFWLMTKHATRVTHFYPLALATFNLLPPPNSIQCELGEHRHAYFTPIHLAFGSEIDMTDFPGHEHPNKKEHRKLRTEHIWKLVKGLYEDITEK